MKDKNRVTGVRGTDRETGNQFQFHAPVVINAAGPWCRDIAARFDKDHPSLFQKRLLLWNVLFKKKAFSDYALGLTPGKGKGHSYFFHPWKNRLLVGTGEALVEKNDDNFPGTSVPPLEMERFIADINKMVPGLKLTGDHIQRVYSGILPANPDGGLAKREAIYDHSTNGGPPGLFSISGVKFTTSRLVAEKTLNLVFPRASAMPYDELLTRMEPGNLSFGYDWEPGGQKDLELLKMIVREESVLHLGDLLIRRTSLADHPERAIRILPKIKPVFDWDQHKWENEVKQFKREMTNKKGNEVTKS
ncbi:MAG: FAD-dependent oxidoreductase [bacterium]|nr:FAD-dependent oxidoreductase [bacterium]